jgi:hypothetical protein
MTVVAGAVAWSICVMLLVLTVLCQRPRWKWLRKLKYRDVAALIPAWTFFAPNPGTTDTRVLWRELRCDGSVSVWKEILPPHGGALRGVWNPRKRASKILTDAGPMVYRLVSANPKSVMPLISVPYLVLLHRVSSEKSSPMTTARQFIVVQTSGSDSAPVQFKPLLMSRWHALDGSVANDSPGAGGRDDGLEATA